MAELRSSIGRRAITALGESKGWSCHYCARPLVPLDRVADICEASGDAYIAPDGYDWPERDHKVARSRGGGNEAGNIVLSCGKCNDRKGIMPYETFVRLVAISDVR